MKQKSLLSFFMLFYFAASAVLFPYYSVYLIRFLPEYEIGILMAIIPVSMMLFQPFWGRLADKYGIRRILASNLALVIASSTGFFFARTFLSLFFVLSVYSIFCVSILPLADTLILQLRPAQYGKIRLWGSFGYGVAVFTAGVLKSHILGFWTFLIHIALLSICLILVLKLPDVRFNGELTGIQPDDGNNTALQGEEGVLKTGKNLPVPETSTFRDKRFVKLLISSFLIGMVVKAFETFFSIGLSNLDASDLLTGSAWILSTAPEVLIFYLLDKLGGKVHSGSIMMTGIAAFAVRMSILAVFPVLWVWVFTQPISSIAFCFWYYGTVKSLNGIADGRQKTRMNTLFWAVTYGAGGMSGSLASGLIVGGSGLTALFFAAALVSLSAFLINKLS